MLQQLRHAHARAHRYCSVCEKTTDTLFACAQCNSAVYCGEICQQQDLKAHMPFCLISNDKGKRKRQQTDYEEGEKKRVVPFGMLPNDIVEVIVKQMSKQDLWTLRTVSNWLANHPRIIRTLQDDYSWRLSDFHDLFPTGGLADWQRGIRRIRYTAQNVAFLNAIVIVFQPERIWQLRLPVYDNDITALSKMTNLRELDLGYLTFADLTPLSNLTKLETLYLTRFEGDITPLSNLKSLRFLHIPRVTHRHITALSNLTNLEVLDLSRVRTGIDALSNLINLRVLWLTTFAGDIAPLSGLIHLEKLYLSKSNPHYKDWKEYLANKI